MRKIWLGAVSVLALGMIAPTAFAADLPAKAPPMVAPIYDWSGIYLGIVGGGAFGKSKHIDAASGAEDTRNFSVNGGQVGGTLGYNYQFGHFVVGLEGDWSWSDRSGRAIEDGGATPGLVGNPAFTDSTKEKWFATARGRFGYATSNAVLFYGTFGYAASNVQASVLSTASGAVLDTITKTRNGWVGGPGIEWGFAPNWSLKGEWLFMRLEDTMPFVTPHAGLAFSRSDVTLDNNILLRIGVNYHIFGGAKY
jgi:outer membrane immunogenic protein